MKQQGVTNTPCLMDRLIVALAKVHAAFPAGDYHFNALQNIAMNSLGEVTVEMAQNSPQLSKALKDEGERHHKWQLSELVRLGVIDEKLAEKELKYRKGLYDNKHRRKGKKN